MGLDLTYDAEGTSFTRRFKSHVQGGATYTLMFAMHDDGGLGISSPGANNQFDYLDGEYATSNDFQRHTARVSSATRSIIKSGVTTRPPRGTPSVEIG